MCSARPKVININDPDFVSYANPLAQTVSVSQFNYFYGGYAQGLDTKDSIKLSVHSTVSTENLRRRNDEYQNV